MSSGSTEREIDEYQDESPSSSGSYESSNESSGSSDSSSQDEHYLSRVPGIPLKEFQEMQCRMTSGVKASSSRMSKSSSPPQDEEEDENVIYRCAPEVASTLDASKLTTLVGRYQIPNEFRPRLPESGELCCSPVSGFGVYASYLLAILRFPLNSFC